MATNFLGSVYNEATYGDLRTSTENPIWAFGTNTKIYGSLGPSDPSGLFSNTWQDSIALDTITNSGFDDPNHPRALVSGQVYHVKFVFYNFEHISLKIEADTFILKQYSIDNYSQYTLELDISAGSSNFFNFCINGWGRNANGSLANVNYDVTITGKTQFDKPDLTDTLSSLGATTVVPGQSLVLNHTLYNRGTLDVATQKFAIYMSTDATITTSDIFLGELTTQGLKAGALQHLTTSTIRMPAGTLPGSYYVGIISDYNGAVAERSETNNVSNALRFVLASADPTTGLPTNYGLGINTLPASLADHEQYQTPASFHFDSLTRLWSIVNNGAKIFQATVRSAAHAIYDFMAAEATEKAEEFAEDFATEHVPGGKIAFDAWKITQPGISFYDSTKVFFDKTWTRLEAAFSAADPTNPNLDATFDIDAVERDLKQYAKENIDRIIGLPVNASLDFAQKVANGLSAIFNHSDLGAKIDLNINPAFSTHLTSGLNGHRNIIAGSQNSEQLRGGDGSDVIYGAGGVDYVIGGAGGDVILGSDGHDRLFAGEGNDVVSGGDGLDFITGDGGNDKLLGGNDADTLIGGLGSDRIFGNGGNDTLVGGAGVDVMVGGPGMDFFLFNASLSILNRDVVIDFNHVDDTVRLENAVFTKLGAGVHALNPAFFRASTRALDANDYIVYNRSSGLLSYDDDGNGAHAAVGFAILANKPVIDASDFAVI